MSAKSSQTLFSKASTTSTVTKSRPTKLQASDLGLVRDLLLLRNQMMCCFGRQPEPNEWVVVKMAGPGVPSKMDTPLSLYGTLHVGEMFENNVFEGLYQLDGEKISPN